MACFPLDEVKRGELHVRENGERLYLILFHIKILAKNLLL